VAVRICFSGKFSFRKLPPFFVFLGQQKRRLGIDFYTRLRSKVSIKSNNKQITAARNRTHTPETKSEISDGAAVAFWVLVILLLFQQFALAVVAFTVLCIFQLQTPPQTAEKEWTMYHGTSQAAAIQIKRGGVHGLRPSTSGTLGAGVYCSRELQKALDYALGGGGVVFEMRVRPGKVKAIRSMSEPLQQTWHQSGYDTAWVPPGVTRSGLEEDCVWDPQRVRIVGVAWSDCGFTW
jgi:hypothetical protein